MSSSSTDLECETHVVIAAGGDDEQAALRLWRALSDRGVSATINDAHIFKGAASHLVALISDSTADSIDFSAQISAFRSVSDRPVLVIRRGTVSRQPPVLSSIRGQGGLLEPANALTDCGTVGDDQASAEAAAEQIATHLGRSRSRAGPAFRPVIAALAASLVLAVGVAGWSLVSTQAALRDARDAARLGEDLMAGLADGFPTSPGGAGLLSLADQLEERLDDIDATRLSTAMLFDQAALFHAIGEVRDHHGEPEKATAAFTRAHDLTGALLAEDRGDPDRIYAHAQSAFYVGDSAFRAGDLETADEYFSIYADLSESLAARDSGNPVYVGELAYAANNLGALALARGEVSRAAELFDEAIALFRGAPLENGVVSELDIANTRGWRADALLASGELEAAVRERAEEAEIYERALAASPDDSFNSYKLANARYGQALSLRQLGRSDEAAEVLESAAVRAARLTRTYPDSVRYARLYMTVLVERARLALWRDEAMRAQLLLREAQAHVARVDEAGQNDDRHFDRGRAHLLAAQIAAHAGADETARAEATEAILAGEQAISAGYERARALLADAYFVHGEAIRAGGDALGAQRSFRSVLTHLEDSGAAQDQPAQLDLRARALWRLDQRDEAGRLRSRLVDMNYARPDFIAFWAGEDRALNASAGSSRREGEIVGQSG